MAIPGHQKLMLPLLKITADGREHSRKDVADVLAKEFALTPEEQAQLLPSGRQEVFVNRIHWARTFLLKAGLLEAPRRGVFQITDRGRKVLKSSPAEITDTYLTQFAEFAAFRSPTSDPDLKVYEDRPEQDTPEEVIDRAYEQRREALADDLLALVKKASPRFFERLVVELLVAMGYGGSIEDAGKAVGKSGDEGIDGIIKEDRLGLDIIYIQAKRWEATVGRPEVQKFAGALQGQRAKKGILITTSCFSGEARDYVSKIDNKIVLIDGDELAGLMIDHNLGVSALASYEVKKIDTDYFTE